jgi:hypothetical protein
MPNIIEQQDLLKGLPDTRLAMLLQNPMGDIPPFLVAAEAQRRQAIRQQFAGSEGKESVVDTLTKQLANVPQNIPAPTRSPPVIPQTPQMQGVAALQAQQAVQQMAQPQGMRAGGMVQRYQSQGLVTPTVDSLAASISGMSLEEYKRKLEQEKIAKLGRGKARYLLENPTVPTSEAEKAEREFYAATEGPFSGFYSPESAYAAAQELAKNNERDSRVFPKLPAGAAGGMNFVPTPPKAAAAPVETPPPEPGETQDEYRARLEKLLAAQEPSDWEKAQGYFAMAEQLLDPSKTTMQSLVGAGQAFAQSAGEQARAQREADLARERGLLEYDMGERNRISAAQAAERERKSLSADQQANILVKSQESVRRVIDSKREQLTKLTSEPFDAKIDPTIPARIAALEKEIARDEERLMNIEGALAALGEQAYGPIPFEPYSLRSGFSR